MMNNKTLIIAILALAVLAGAYALFTGIALAPTVEEGAPTGGTFSYVNSSADLIQVTAPKPSESVGQKFSISGSARGYWYFEASFPIEVRDRNGALLGQGIGTAEGEWMTEEFVPFKAIVELSAPYSGQAFLVLKRDNPSGEPENDASVSLPLVIQ